MTPRRPDENHAFRLPVRPATGRHLAWSVVLWSGGFTATLLANPQGLTVVSGSATPVVNGSQLTLNVSHQAVLDWKTFNIAPGETTAFVQPSSQSVVLNNIRDQNASQIWGNITANGTVILANAHGFYFGPNSMISVGGSFVATTASLPPDFGFTGLWTFTRLPPAADIVNYGTVESHGGGSVFLIAERVENHGVLAASGGDIWLTAGKEVLLSQRPDGRGLSAKVTVPTGSVDNLGRITADAGTIGLHARVVNQGGVLQADSVREHNGVIELVASEQLSLGANSTIRARGDGSGNSPGGQVTLKSGGGFADSASSRVDLRGGSQGGQGGALEISAQNFQSFASQLDASATAGFKGGSLLVDPADIELGTTGTGQIGGGGTVGSGGGGTLQLNVNTAFSQGGFADITLQATHNITLKSGTVWNLSTSTGLADGAHRLTLQAGQDILFENNARITDANSWSVTLEAGYSFATRQVVAGNGSIYLNGGAGKSLNGALETAQGSIEAAAGKDILVGLGYIRTVGGGSIHLQALAGDVDAGKRNDSYEFISTGAGYRVSTATSNGLTGPGGITTTKGGNVTLEAGNDIISSPTLVTGRPPGGSGALGAEAGDVTLKAGHVIRGNYFLRNGTGKLLAGVTLTADPLTHLDTVPQVTNPAADIGTELDPVSLNLVSGSWSLWSGRDIFLREIRNPNGTFNGIALPVAAGTYPGNSSGGLGADEVVVNPSRNSAFRFDYAPTAAANLWAADGITLLGSNLPRVSGQNDKNPVIVYPPQLALEAGAGGIQLRNSLTLFPSSQGSLSIVTHGGGNFTGPQPQRDESTGDVSPLVTLTMSDSGLPGYATFAQGHAVVPLHLLDPDPVRVVVDGDIRNLTLTVPTAANVTVHGDTYNFGLNAQNLATATLPGGTGLTTLTVDGDITYRGNLTETGLATALPAQFFDLRLISNPALVQRVLYNATTGKLAFIGQMSQSERDYLQNPQLLVFDALTGAPVMDPATGLQKTTPLALSDVYRTAFQDLYERSGDASLGGQGLSVTGPGKFVVTAHNADLGISGGIIVKGPTAPLARISPLGAALEVSVANNLEMTSTRISNEGYLGSVQVTAEAGHINVGSAESALSESSQIKGIFTTGGGGATVTAHDDINVNVSRIATYNGGNIAVTSVAGNVNAGTGGNGYVTVNALELVPGAEPGQSVLHSIFDTVPGSGILVATVRGGTVPLGSISVKTETGSINAGLGGFFQQNRNGLDTGDAGIFLDAAKDIDASNSGIIGRNISLKAGGDVRGLIIGRGSVNIEGQNVAVNAIGTGSVNISASGTVSGTVVGSGSVSVSGDSISASLVSKSVTASGDTSSASLGVPASTVAKADSKVADDGAATASRSSESSLDDEDRKKRLAGGAKLNRYVGRVTVILPAKSAN
jgi:filamentous hemagglutinin family protein